jgi:hypothetical protein
MDLALDPISGFAEIVNAVYGFARRIKGKGEQFPIEIPKIIGAFSVRAACEPVTDPPSSLPRYSSWRRSDLNKSVCSTAAVFVSFSIGKCFCVEMISRMDCGEAGIITLHLQP